MVHETEEAVVRGGVTLWTRRWRSPAPERPPIVVLHGGPGLDHHVLLPLGRALAAALAGGREVWLPDLPGHGRSVAPSGRLPGLAGVEDRLVAWLHGMVAGSGVLVGHSLGAWLVREMLRRGRLHPGAAVLLSPPAAGQSGASSALTRAARLRNPHPGRRAVPRDLHPGEGARRARRELLAHLAAECAGGPSEEILTSLEAAVLRPPWEYGPLLKNLHRALTGPVRSFDPGCPVLVVCGEEDRTTPPAQARRVVASIAGARLEILPGLGHYPFAERPQEVADRIAGFLVRETSEPGV